MLLGDKLGKRVYTQKNAGEIKKALEKLIADNHPYMQNINDFDISKIIKSLNKIGLASVAPAAIATGAASSLMNNPYQQQNTQNFKLGVNFPFDNGGEVMELTDDQVEQYKAGGYIIEEYPDGGITRGPEYDSRYGILGRFSYKNNF